jgi:phosphomannomutase
VREALWLGYFCYSLVNWPTGIAVDPDVDRCVFIDETGKPIGEEYTLAIAVKFMLGHVGRRGVVCKNLSSSRAIDDVAKEYGCSVFAAKVGEINVAESMLAQKAIIGGEGNGGVMLPDVHIGRDAPVAAALVVMQLALFGGSMSALKASLPQWEIVKMKARLPRT